jgi:hypothetical protein
MPTVRKLSSKLAVDIKFPERRREKVPYQPFGLPPLLDNKSALSRGRKMSHQTPPAKRIQLFTHRYNSGSQENKFVAETLRSVLSKVLCHPNVSFASELFSRTLPRSRPGAFFLAMM